MNRLNLIKKIITKNKFKSVKLNGLSLKYIDDKDKTYKLCWEAIKQNPLSLKYIPEKFKTKKICEKAIKDCHWNLKYIPISFISREMCLRTIEDIDIIFLLIDTLPDLSNLLELKEKANEEFSTFLLINKFYNDKEFIKQAIEKCPYYVFSLPEKEYNSELFLKVINLNMSLIRKNILNYIPKEYKNKEIYEAVFSSDKDAIELIPNEYKTEKMCLKSLESSYNIKFIPKNLKTESFYLKALNKNKDVLKEIKHIDKQLYKKLKGYLVNR